MYPPGKPEVHAPSTSTVINISVAVHKFEKKPIDQTAAQNQNNGQHVLTNYKTRNSTSFSVSDEQHVVLLLV